MSHMTMVTIEVPEKLYRDLQALAETQHTSVSEIIQALVDVQVEDDFKETPDEKILADFLEAWREVMRSEEDIPAREALAEIRRERNQNGN